MQNHRKVFWGILGVGVLVCLAAVFGLVSRSRQEYRVRVILPAQCVGKYSYADEMITSKGGKIRLTAGEGWTEAKVILIPLESTGRMQMIGPVSLKAGEELKLGVERNTPYVLCANIDNPSDRVQAVYVNIKGAGVHAMTNNADRTLPLVMKAGNGEELVIGRRNMRYENWRSLWESQSNERFLRYLANRPALETKDGMRISLPDGYALDAYDEKSGLAGGTAIQPASTGSLGRFDAAMADIRFDSGIPELNADGIPVWNGGVRQEGVVVGLRQNKEDWPYIRVRETKTSDGGGNEGDYYYYYYVKEGEAFYYYLALSTKEFTMDQADRIACTVKIQKTK